MGYLMPIKFLWNRGFWGGYVKEYIEATKPAFAIGEYWDSLAYEGGRVCYNQGSAILPSDPWGTYSTLFACLEMLEDSVSVMCHGTVPLCPKAKVAGCRSLGASCVPWYWMVQGWGADSHRQRIINWINAAGGTSSAFDVTTKVQQYHESFLPWKWSSFPCNYGLSCSLKGLKGVNTDFTCI